MVGTLESFLHEQMMAGLPNIHSDQGAKWRIWLQGLEKALLIKKSVIPPFGGNLNFYN